MFGRARMSKLCKLNFIGLKNVGASVLNSF